MIKSDEGTPDQAQVEMSSHSINRAQAWFWVMLWILPSGFFVASAIGLGWVHGNFFRHDLVVVLWFLLNLAFLIGTGWFQSILANQGRIRPHTVIRSIGAFMVYQLFLIPILLGLLLYLTYLIDPFWF